MAGINTTYSSRFNTLAKVVLALHTLAAVAVSLLFGFVGIVGSLFADDPNVNYPLQFSFLLGVPLVVIVLLVISFRNYSEHNYRKTVLISGFFCIVITAWVVGIVIYVKVHDYTIEHNQSELVSNLASAVPQGFKETYDSYDSDSGTYVLSYDAPSTSTFPNLKILETSRDVQAAYNSELASNDFSFCTPSQMFAFDGSPGTLFTCKTGNEFAAYALLWHNSRMEVAVILAGVSPSISYYQNLMKILSIMAKI